MTTTLHIENTVHDFDAWKEVFDRFDRFRSDGGVVAYRLSRPLDDPHVVVIDLDFPSTTLAEAFHDRLRKVWATPQSQAQLRAHRATLHEVLEQHPT